MKKNNIKYFLATNSCEGFYSEFDNSYLPDGEWRAYIIKCGPGTGKSSFMKRFADAAENKGERALRCPCSSDPDSLDAVILPDKKIVIMDGTAPHTVDPKFPGVCEKILNFGEFWVDNTYRLQIERYELMSDEELDNLFRPKKTNSRKSMAPLFVYLILKEHSSSEKHLRQQDILKILEGYPCEVPLERKALSRIIHNITDSQLSVFSDKTGTWLEQEEK